MLEWFILIAAAFFAGILNSIAGGGSFLTLPALVFTGIPEVAANATSAVAVFPGYLGAAAGFRRELYAFDRVRLGRYLLVAAIGGLLGSLLLLITSNAFFASLVPWLLFFATAMFALGSRLTSWLQRRARPYLVPQYWVLFLVAIYGGYFNGGLGIILLAAFVTFGMDNLNLMNGLKNGLSLIISAVSVTTFALAGIIHWPQAMVMMVAATAGGYSGALVAKALPPSLIRTIIVVVGLVMTLLFFLR